MAIVNCPNCGGIHYGSHKCPFITSPCVICGDDTVMACSDCAIETGKSVHVCAKPKCRDQHEADTHLKETPIDAAPDMAATIARQAAVIAKMREALQECESYFDDRSDVVDGDYGSPKPNAEMTLLSEVRAALVEGR